MDQLVVLRSNEKCQFCTSSQNNQLKYGPLYQLKDVVAHYYCVLLSTKMKQNGTDREGVLGFLLSDIKTELRRTTNIKCTYCKKGRATIECCHSKCKKVFHLPCGLNAGSLHQFMGSFSSYCFTHKPVQFIPEKIMNEMSNSEVKCAICFEELNIRDKKDTLWAPCCKKTWYHRTCIQKFAHSAGYFFKCAICNDDQEFKKCMLRFGIFIPQQDASWELEPNAFEELLFKYNQCDAENCKCPFGRQKNTENTSWEIVLCQSCGSNGIHRFCGSIKYFRRKWECVICRVVSENNPATGTSRRKLSFKSSSSNSRNEVKGKKKRMRVSENLENSIIVKRKKRRYSYEKLVVRMQSVEETTNQHKTYERTNGDKLDVDEDESVEVDVETTEPKKSDRNYNIHEVLSKLKPGPLSYKLGLIREEFGNFPSTSEKNNVPEVILDSDSEKDITDLSDSSLEKDDGSDIEVIMELKNTVCKEHFSSREHYGAERNTPFRHSGKDKEDEEVEVVECVNFCQLPNRITKKKNVIEVVDLCQQPNPFAINEGNRISFSLNNFEIIGALNFLPVNPNQVNQVTSVCNDDPLHFL